MKTITRGSDLPLPLQAHLLSTLRPPNSTWPAAVWLSRHGFYVTRAGTLDNRFRQAWLLRGNA